MKVLDMGKRMSVQSAQVNKGTMLTKDQVIALLKKKQGEKSGRDFAAELGISPVYLSDVYLGKRTPGPAILEKLGLTQRIVYERQTA